MVCKEDLRHRHKITRDPPKMKKVRGNVITSVFLLNLSIFEFDGGFFGNKMYAFKIKRTLLKVNWRLRNCFKPQSALYSLLLVSWWFFCVALCKVNRVGNLSLSTCVSMYICRSVQIVYGYLDLYGTSLRPVEFLLTESSVLWGFRSLAWCICGVNSLREIPNPLCFT